MSHLASLTNNQDSSAFSPTRGAAVLLCDGAGGSMSHNNCSALVFMKQNPPNRFGSARKKSRKQNCTLKLLKEE